jgi:hypothetical protein
MKTTTLTAPAKMLSIKKNKQRTRDGKLKDLQARRFFLDMRVYTNH